MDVVKFFGDYWVFILVGSLFLFFLACLIWGKPTGRRQQVQDTYNHGTNGFSAGGGQVSGD